MVNWELNMRFIDGEKYILSVRKNNNRDEFQVGKYVKYDGRGGGHTPHWGAIFESNLAELRRLANGE